ncbi:hypothetical protein QAD02_005428 [Eretmocerus hayati]|uniref:Uncharacterized protein n=1 Tax=Eretmocerus hayati TaxID=131215 RepID=A0ACC2NSQ7_9HYME|nr:hypothetical protein QAD02_005428 [Eretmocerus hayati]
MLSNEEAPFTLVKGKSTKKSKNETTIDSSNLNEQLKDAKEYIDSSAKTLPLSYEKLLEFLEATKKKSTTEIANLARLYCNDFEALSVMLTDTYKYVSGRTIRARLTRVKNSLLSPVIDNNTQDDNNSQGVCTDTESITDDPTLDEHADRNQYSLINKDGCDE